MKYRKIVFLFLSAVLALGTFVPQIGANTVQTQEKSTKVDNEFEQLTVEENEIYKEDLIARIDELFPARFNFLNEGDFHLNQSHLFYGDDEDEVIRHSISFHKQLEGKSIHGNFEFVGEELSLQGFNYQPLNQSDALFPPKVSKEEAQQIADAFLQEVKSSEKYQLREGEDYFYGSSNRVLTEPIRYDFQYERLENNVPVSNQVIRISVLGNGEVVSYYGNMEQVQSLTFEEKKDVIDQTEIINKIKENLKLDLRYIINFDQQTKESNVELTYVPQPAFHGIHAKTGEWQLYGEFTDELGAQEEIKMLSIETRDHTAKPISRSEAKALAESMLEPKDDHVKLRINEISERENQQGQQVYSISYMYEERNSGFGSSMEINKETGDVIRFSGYHNFNRYETQPTDSPEISYEAALKNAVEFIGTYVPSQIHRFAYPVQPANQKAQQGVYHFNFPRIENGVIVNNNNINVSISSEDGSLASFNTYINEVKKFPALESALSTEEAKKAFLEDLEVSMVYMNDYQSDNRYHYYLVYLVQYNQNHSYYNAVTGEWKRYPHSPGESEAEKPKVAHAWAEEELNFMIEAGIIRIEGIETFNPDEKVTKGEALEVVMRSLTRFWENNYPPYSDQQQKQTFENIDPSHSLYQIVERAVESGVIDRKQKTFDIDAPLTRQELASWYTRALGFQLLAEQSEIFQINYIDADLIKEEYKGSVAITVGLGILIGSSDNFLPEQEVTLAQLAVSSFRLAHQISNTNQQRFR